MKVLFFKPFMVYNPRAVRVLEEIEDELQKGNEVIFVGCNGELINGCLDNPLRSKIACSSCRYFKRNDLSLLSKKITTYSIGDFLPTNQYKNQTWEYNNAKDIKNLEYKKVDVGFAALSAYIQLTRNHMPKVNDEFKVFFNRFLDTGAYVTDAASIILDKVKPDLVNVFNARIHTRRPILRICQQNKITCNVLEHTGVNNKRICKKVTFKDCLPQDITFNTAYINEVWNRSNLQKDEKIRISSEYYEKQHAGNAMTDKSYVKSQEEGLLPSNWDVNKRNITIYNSSDDEMASLGKEWEFKLSHSKLDTIETILKKFKEENYHFYLRMHPNLGGLEYKYVYEYTNLERYDNFTIIPADSKINSYSLLHASEKVITLGSSIGIEAVYWGKPSILIGSSLYMNLGANYIPNNTEELLSLISNNLEPKDKEGAYIFSFFRLMKGEKFEFFNPNFTKYRTIKIKDKLLASFRNNYREDRYKTIFPVLINFIKYKQHSIPKNLWIKLNKKFIPKLD